MFSPEAKAEILQSETITIQDCNESLVATYMIPSTSRDAHSLIRSTSTQIDSPDLMMSS